MNFPRILIYGQPFNNRHGGGITLSNLFKGWEKSKIAVADTGHMMDNVTTDICDTYFQLGNEEFKWRFPFNYIQRKFPSGLKNFNANSVNISVVERKKFRYIIVNNVFYPALEWLGLFHCVSKIKMSSAFTKWLTEFNPEVLYIQVSTREMVLFAIDIIDYLKIPVAIHFMDDWPSTISRRGLFRKFWERKIDGELKTLLNRVDLFLSISDAMSNEYERRYGKTFIPFHNPIESDKFLSLPRVQTGDHKVFRILYIGRIGIANRESIFSFSRFVSEMAHKTQEVQFHIYTPNINSPEMFRLKNLPNVSVLPAVEHQKIPDLLRVYDLLFLPLDFSQNGIKYAKFSMPTKASEYMISGTPVLVFAPGETAISQFFIQNECGYCVTKNDFNELAKAVDFLIRNEEYRNKISSNAVYIALDRFDVLKVRAGFQKLLVDLKNTRKDVHK